jgi:hypothetical protein
MPAQAQRLQEHPVFDRNPEQSCLLPPSVEEARGGWNWPCSGTRAPERSRCGAPMPTTTKRWVGSGGTVYFWGWAFAMDGSASLSFPARWMGLFFLWACVVGLRWASPSDLMDNGQQTQAAYLADLYYNSSWLYQRDTSGNYLSKPPLYTWLAAVASYLRGSADELALLAPCALAALGLLISTARACVREGHAEWAFWVAVAFLGSPLGIKLTWLARTDTLFAFLTWCAAWQLYRFLNGSSRAGLTFWLLAALATLTKGPLCLLLAGTAAFLYGRHASSKAAESWRWFVAGIPLWAVICLGWLIAAWSQAGWRLVVHLLGREFLQHALFGVEWRPPLFNCYKPLLSFFVRFAPWSVLAGMVCWRWTRQQDMMEPFLRFCCCYLVAGLALLAISPHHRADHLAPLLPAAAIAAAAELQRLLKDRPQWLTLLPLGVFAIALALGSVHYGVLLRERPAVQRTSLVRACAQQLQDQGLAPELLIPYRASAAFQFYFGMHRPERDVDEVLAALCNGQPALVVTQHPDWLLQRLSWVDPSGALVSLVHRQYHLRPCDEALALFFLGRMGSGSPARFNPPSSTWTDVASLNPSEVQ